MKQQKIAQRKLIGRAVKLFAVLCSLFVLASCSKDYDTPAEEDVKRGNGSEIAFNFSIEQPQGTNAGIKTKTTTTADFKTTFVDGDEVGLYAVRRATTDNTATLATSGNYIPNVKLTYSANDNKWTVNPATPIYYAGEGYVLDFYAYYPYDASATNPLNITFNVKSDQSTAVNYNKSDLLWAKTSAGVAKGTPVDLTFTHILALVEVAVDPGTMTGSGPANELTLTLRGCKVGGVFSVADGGLTVDGSAQPQSVKMLRVESDPRTATTYTYRALVPAQSVMQGSSLCLMSQNGALYSTPSLTAPLTLAVGDAKRYNAKLPATALQTVKITAGTFIMGEAVYAEPTHTVILTKNFYMSKYEITNVQYAAFLNSAGILDDGKGGVTYYDELGNLKTNKTQTLIEDHSWGVQWNAGSSLWEPASGKGNFPVVRVSWYGAKAYVDWLSIQTSQNWTLPTEAEWEYACRAGTTTPFSFDGDENNMDAYGWSWENSSDGTKAVGRKLPNPWGLYDMHGNVLEWCSDWYHSYSGGEVTDPTGPTTAGSGRVLRGGSWYDLAQLCRSAYRSDYIPDYASSNVGFRVVVVP